MANADNPAPLPQVTILTGDPIIEVLAEMNLRHEGLVGLIEWLKKHRPNCLPDGITFDRTDHLFPHNLRDPKLNRELTHNELLVELAGRKCIAAGSIVETDRGPVKIEQVVVGDRVVTPQGLFRVEAVSDNGEKELVIVQTRAGYGVMCTPDHLILTEGGWVEAQNLSFGDVVCLQPGVPWKNGPGTFEAGYACGLFLGDGTFAGDDFRTANLRLFGDKMALMPYVEEAVGSESRPYRDGKALSLNSKPWADWFLQFGIRHGSKTVTPLVETASSDFQRGVLSGLWDTDGSLEVNKKTRRAYYCSSDRAALAAVQRMLLRQGIFSRVRLDRAPQEHLVICGVPTTGKAAYKLTITGEDFIRFANTVGSRRRGPALRAAADRPQRRSPSTSFGEVMDVQPFGSGRVFDLSIERGSPHCFVANGIVVHNCYDSFGQKAGRKSNAEYIAHTQEGDIPHSSIMYHAKMTFFFAGISRRVTHEIIRNYVGADRSEEGNPSQESTRFTHHYGYFVLPPRYEDSVVMRTHFQVAMEKAYSFYLDAVAMEHAGFEAASGKAPTSMDRKRIYEAASSFLPHQAETSMIWTTNPAWIAKFCKERNNAAADLEVQRFARKLKAVSTSRWPNLFPQPWMSVVAPNPEISG